MAIRAPLTAGSQAGEILTASVGGSVLASDTVG